MLLESKNPTPDHLLVTADDRYFGEGKKILWIDWPWDTVLQTSRMLEGSPVKLIIHTFGANDTNFRWLLDVAHQSDLICINAASHSPADPIKGHLIHLDKSIYFGRSDLSDIFSGYIEDPIGYMLAWVGTQEE